MPTLCESREVCQFIEKPSVRIVPFDLKTCSDYKSENTRNPACADPQSSIVGISDVKGSLDMAGQQHYEEHRLMAMRLSNADETDQSTQHANNKISHVSLNTKRIFSSISNALGMNPAKVLNQCWGHLSGVAITGILREIRAKVASILMRM